MNLDLVTFKIEWKNNNKLIAECNVPNNIRGKPIFLSILLACKDDEVEMKID